MNDRLNRLLFGGSQPEPATSQPATSSPTSSPPPIAQRLAALGAGPMVVAILVLWFTRGRR